MDDAISEFQEVGDNIYDMDIDCYNNSESESEESGSDVDKEELAEEIREVDEYHFSKVYDASNLIDKDLLIRRKIPDSSFPLCNKAKQLILDSFNILKEKPSFILYEFQRYDLNT